jgi:uncharacterized membrane protein YkoI
MAFAFLAVPLAGEAAAACLSAKEQRQTIRSGQALRPAQIGRILNGEVIRIQLCEARGALIYQVTVLTGTGQVKRHIVDARSGRVIR